MKAGLELKADFPEALGTGGAKGRFPLAARRGLKLEARKAARFKGFESLAPRGAVEASGRAFG